MLDTRITRLLGIRHPIVQSGMRWLSRAELAAAVSQAGALGLLSAHTFADGPALRAEIARTRALTSQPFGVNLTLLAGARFDYDGYIRAIIESRVPVVETSGSNPTEVIGRLKEAGIRVIHKCTAVKHAAKAVAAGADAIAIDGFECAGHTGMDDVSSMVLLRAAARQLDAPLLACGGFADGASLAAALALGADGVAMGTRFMLTRESPVPETIKQRMLKASERDTLQIGRSYGDPIRVLKNDVAQALAQQERTGAADRQAIHEAMDARHWMAAFETGAPEQAPLPVGMAVGLMDELLTCQEVVEGMVRDAHELITGRLAKLAGPGA